MTLDLRFLLRLLLICVPLAAGTFLLHRYQVRQQTGAFLRQADAAKEANNADQENEYLRRYLVAEPRDIDARIRLADLVERSARRSSELEEAYLLREEVLRRQPERDDERRKQVQLALHPRMPQLLALGREHLEKLLATHPLDAELKLLYARCLIASRDYSTALVWLTRSIENNPQPPEPYALQAMLLRRELKQPAEADAAIRTMIERNPNSKPARLAALAYWQEYGTRDEKTAALAEALKALPNDGNVLRAVADQQRDLAAELSERQDPQAQDVRERARAGYREGLARDVKDIGCYRGLALLELQSGQLAAADAILREGLKALPEDPALLESLTDLAIDHSTGDVEGLLERLQAAGADADRVGYLKARRAIRQEQWLPAAKLLDAVSNTGAPDFRRRVAYLQGIVREMLSDRDRQAAAFRAAIPEDPADPLRIPALIRLAEALASQGRHDDAIAAYGKVRGAVPTVALPMARQLYLRTIKQAPADRKWPEVEKAVNDIPVGPDKVEPGAVALLRAEMLVAQQQRDAARALLQESRLKYRSNMDVVIASCLLEVLDDKPEAALELLGNAEEKLGDRVELRVLRARLLPQKPESVPALKALFNDSAKFPPTDRRFLGLTLGDFIEIVAPLEAIGLDTELATAFPDDLRVQRVRFDRAARRKDIPAMRAALPGLAHVDGETGPTYRLSRTLIRVQEALNGDTTAAADATAQLAELARERPSFGLIALAQAFLLDRASKPEAALAKYRQAFDSGERRPDQLRRMIELMYRYRQFNEAADLLRQVPGTWSRGPVGDRLAAMIALQAGDPAQALERASLAVPVDSKSVDDRLWLAQVRAAAGKFAEAEVEFKTACTLAPTQPEPWLARIHFLDRSGRTDEAKKLLETEAIPALAAEHKLFTEAVARDLLRQTDAAIGAYAKAVAAAPTDRQTLRGAVLFSLRQADLETAKGLLEKFAAAPAQTAEDQAFIRRQRAITLAASNDPLVVRQALALIGYGDGVTPEPTDDPDETRVRALVLAMHPSEKRNQEALRLLEQIATRRELPAQERFLLARISLMRGDAKRAEGAFASLLKQDPDQPAILETFASWLLDKNRPTDAAPWIDRLIRLRPDALSTITLQARLLAKADRLKEAQALLTSFAERKPERARESADVLDRLNLLEAAESIYRKEAATQKPEAVRSLAVFLARHDRSREAVELCERDVDHIIPEKLASILVSTLYAVNEPDRDLAKRALRLVDASVEKNPKSAYLLNQQAALRIVAGDNLGGADCYRQILKLNARDIIALNNLAYVLSFDVAARAEAIRYVDEAKAIAGGDTYFLLDTEGFVRFAQGDVVRAIEKFKLAIDANPIPAAFFHLTRAYVSAGRLTEARTAWDEAVKRGLRPLDLHPLERSEVPALKKRFDVK